MTETWLTQAAYDALVAELENREGPMRREVTGKIERAREEGDLKENGGYHAAREEQGTNEARIRYLRAFLEKAQVGAPDSHPNEVSHGKVITVHFQALGQEQTFLLGSREEAAHASIDVYSPSSPLGEAILGKHVGDSATYTLPNGKPMTVAIVAVAPYGA